VRGARALEVLPERRDGLLGVDREVHAPSAPTVPPRGAKAAYAPGVMASYLVDGHNVLGRLLATKPTDADEQRRFVLVRVAAAVRTRRGGPTGDRAHVVFDSEPSNPRAGTHGRDGPTSWSYARGSADEEIVRLVREHGGRDGGKPMIVVTDDRELAGRVAQLGADTLHVHEWLDEPPADASPPSSRRERPLPSGPPLTAGDFGLPDSIDLDDVDPDAL
jgi:hypothetical protein